jgi:hypothetical protein
MTRLCAPDQGVRGGPTWSLDRVGDQSNILPLDLILRLKLGILNSAHSITD